MAKSTEAQKAYNRAYYLANAEKIKARAAARRAADPGLSARWYAANRESAKAKSKAWILAHPEHVKARAKAYNVKMAPIRAVYYLENKERISVRNAEWKRNNADRRKQNWIEYRCKNIEEIAARNAAWQRENKGKCRAYGARYFAAKKNAIPAWADLREIEEIYEKCRLVSDETGIKHHVDHIVPLQSKIVCGLHCEANLQILTLSENSSKGNKWWPDMP